LSQVASSVSNVGLIIGAAHVGGDELVGTVGTLTASYLVALSIGRGLVGDPWLLSKDPGRDEDAAGLAVLIGVAAGVAAWFALRNLLSGNQPALAVVALGLPALLAQDALRFVAFRRRRPRLAAAGDVLWAVVAAVGIAWTVAAGEATVLGFIACWVGGGALAALFLGWRFRVAPSLAGGASLLRREPRLRASLLWDSLLTNGAIQVALLLTAWVAGLAAAGQIRLLQAVFGPVTLLYGVTYVSEATRGSGTPLRPVDTALRIARRLTVASLVVAAALWIVPTGLGVEVAGETFLAAQALLMAFLAPQIISVVGAAGMAGLRFDGRADVAARIRTPWALALVAGTVAGGEFAGVLGVIAGTAVAHTLATVAWWRALLRSGS
jgi:hypothetical protein